MTISKRPNYTVCKLGFERWGFDFSALTIYLPSTIWEVRWSR